jgi:hypothetical protein
MMLGATLVALPVHSGGPAIEYLHPVRADIARPVSGSL